MAAKKRFAIGIDLGGTNLKGILLDSDGGSHHLTRIPTQASRGGAHVLERVVELTGMLLAKLGKNGAVVGVGIGTPGFVDGDGTVLGGAENIPGWKGTQLYLPVRERFNLGAVAGNDVTVTALAESRFGAGKGIANLVCLALGTGIGGGIIIDHKVYQGSHGMAGELGHIPVETSQGLACTCGQSGCVEQYASAGGIVRNAKLLCVKAEGAERTPFVKAVLADPDAVTSKMVYEFVERGDSIALTVNEYCCSRLARAIGVCLNAFAPDRVILGGGVMMAGRVIIDTVNRYLPSFCWQSIRERCDIVQAQCGEDAGVLGAAALAFDSFDTVVQQDHRSSGPAEGRCTSAAVGAGAAG